MYQPPFNLFAYATLLPLSWVLSPRALHTVNVFLIRLTVSMRRYPDLIWLTVLPQSFPILITIGLYERYLSLGKKIQASGMRRAQSVYNSLPRNLKKMPIVEVLVGVNSKSVHDAIFDVEMSEEAEDALLDELQLEDDDEPALRSLASRESIRWRQKSRTRTPSSRRIRVDTNLPPSPTSGVPSPEPPLSPRRQRRDTGLSLEIGPSGGLNVPNLQPQRSSPLARLFSGPRLMSPTSEITVVPPTDSPMPDETAESMRRIEGVLDEIRSLPIRGLKDEMKELQVSSCATFSCFESLITTLLQDRQARIESLLLTLTRGMRGEASGRSGGSRQSK